MLLFLFALLHKKGKRKVIRNSSSANESRRRHCTIVLFIECKIMELERQAREEVKTKVSQSTLI